MKTIIAATDFSAAANNATNYAADMAAAIGADLLLVNIWKIPVNYDGMATPQIGDDIMEAAKISMGKLEMQLNIRVKGTINISHKIRMGEFVNEVETICNSIKPYAVVMGSQGTTAAERAIFGGHTIHAMKNLQWPLITVPPGTSFTAIKKIGLACDLHNVKESLPVDEIIKLVKDYNATLHILNTGKKETFDANVVFESGILRKMLTGIEPCYHFISNEDIDDGIIDFAEKNKIDLLIVLPKRHNLFDKLLHKSHTKQLILHSPVPVMTLHK